jgi:hypothetical protein
MTNGCEIYNNVFGIMKNGDKINPGIYSEEYSCNGSGFRIRDGSLILPYQNKYLLLHSTVTIDKSKPISKFYVPGLNYSIIDMKGDNGKGEVILKNKVLINDTLSIGDIAACRHANGTDWWVIVPRGSLPDSTNNNKYYRFLITQDTIQGPWEQQIGIKLAC